MAYRYDVVDPWTAAQANLSLSLWLLGHPERALMHSQQALRLARALDHPFSYVLTLGYVAMLHHFCHDVEGTAAAATQALTLAAAKGFEFWICWVKVLHGWALAEGGAAEEALVEIRQGLLEWQTQGFGLSRGYLLSVLAQSCARRGRCDEGLQALGEAQAVTNASNELFWKPELYRLQGELALQRDPTTVALAEGCFQKALTVARRQQARSLELRAAMSLSRLWRHQGKSQAAHDLLAPIYASISEGFQTLDLKMAAAMLQQVRTADPMQP
jgi:predicted ATPase